MKNNNNLTSPPRNKRKPLFVTLRSRLMALLGSIFFVIIIVLFFTITYYVRRADLQVWHYRQQEAANNTALLIETYIKNNQGALQWIDLMGVDKFIDEPQLLKSVLQTNPEIIEIIYLDKHGHALVNISSEKIMLGNLFTIPQSEWYRVAHSGEPYYTSLQISPQDEIYIIYATPANENGVLAIRLKMDYFEKIIKESDFNNTGVTFITDKSGRIIAHSDDSILRSGQTIENRPEFATIMQSQDKKWSGETRDFYGNRVLSLSTAIGTTNWILFTEIPILKVYSTSRLVSLLVPVFLTFVVYLALRVLRKSMSRIFIEPLKAVQDGSVRLAGGELDYRIQSNSQDEIGQLASMFNRMAEQLQLQQNALISTNANLESRVVERTKKLQEEQDLLMLMEERHLALLNAIPDRIFRLDQAGVIIDYKAYDENDELIQPNFYFGKSVEILFPPEFGSTARTAIKNAFETLKIQTFDFVVTNETEVKYFEVRAVRSGSHEVIFIIQNITERKLAEDRLKASLKEKQILLKEIHHRVKNNLQIINSLLNLQSKAVTDPQTLVILHESQNRIRAMALIHEKLYQTENLESIHFNEYIRNLVTSLLRSSRNNQQVIRVTYVEDDINLPLESAIPCGLIMNELITNSIKYAFVDGRQGEITIGINESINHTIELSVKDNGKGFPEDLDLNQSPTLGWQLINSLAGQLDASVQIQNDQGASISIKFQRIINSEGIK